MFAHIYMKVNKLSLEQVCNVYYKLNAHVLITFVHGYMKVNKLSL